MADEDNIIWYLTDGYWEDHGLARHTFRARTGDTLTVNITGLTTEGQQLARWALDAWSTVTGLRFQEVSHNNAHIMFYDHMEGAFSNYRYYLDDGSTAFAWVNVSTAWLNRYGTEIDTYSFTTYLHEIGHALGLGHPGNYNYDGFTLITHQNDAKYPQADGWLFTVMSYFHQDENIHTDPFADIAFVASPMLIDVVAIQDLYGEPWGVNEGDTVYGHESNASAYMQEVFRVWDEGAQGFFRYPTNMALTIYDSGGIDWLDFRNDTYNQVINLELVADLASISSVYGGEGNLVLISTIEHVWAGSGDDVVFGNAENNIVIGGYGHDGILGHGGDDFLVGGPGDDVLRGGNGHDLLWGSTGRDELTGGAGSDVFLFYQDDGFTLDYILDFTPGVDRIDLRDFPTIDSYSDIVHRYVPYSTTDSYLDLMEHGGGWIELKGIGHALSDTDFIFADNAMVV